MSLLSFNRFFEENNFIVQVMLAWLHLFTAFAIPYLPVQNDIAFTVVRFDNDSNKTFVFDMDLRNAIAAFEAITAAAHFLYCTDFGRKQSRMFEYFITSPIMILIIASLCGVEDVFTLFQLFILQQCVIMFGYIQEIVVNNITLIPFIAGLLPYTAEWTVISYYFGKSMQNESDNAEMSKATISVFFVITFILFGSFAVNMFLWLIGTPGYDNNTYLHVSDVLSLTSKLFLSWFVYGAIVN